MPEKWDQVKELFTLALERDPEVRPGFLRQACGGDDSLCAEPPLTAAWIRTPWVGWPADTQVGSCTYPHHANSAHYAHRAGASTLWARDRPRRCFRAVTAIRSPR